jgi:ammonia channel protein AmtB
MDSTGAGLLAHQQIVVQVAGVMALVVVVVVVVVIVVVVVANVMLLRSPAMVDPRISSVAAG